MFRKKSEARCRHTSADGRRCRMPCAPGHHSLCLPHRQRQEKESDAEAIAAELLGPFAEFNTATAVNHALGKLFSLAAQDRIPPRNAAVLAYIGQLLLNSLGAVRHEAQLARGHDEWHALLRRTLRLPDFARERREAIRGRQDMLAELERAAQSGPVEVKIVGPSQREEDSDG
jgi:hypothetical protein